MQIFTPENYGANMMLIPRFLIIIIVFIALHKSIPLAIVYATTFGLLYDIIYTDFIGIYMFTMALTTYLVGQSAKVVHINAIVGLVIAFVTVIVLDFQVYGIYMLIGIADLPIKYFLFERLIPSIVLNGVFLILMYIPMRKVMKVVE